MSLAIALSALIALNPAAWADLGIQVSAEAPTRTTPTHHKDTARVVAALSQRPLPSPVPGGRTTVWSVDLASSDIWGGQEAGMTIALDNRGDIWIQDQSLPFLMDLNDQVDLFLKAGWEPITLMSGKGPVLATWMNLGKECDSVPYLKAIVTAWASVPPPDPASFEGGVAHLGTDVYGVWRVHSKRMPVAYRKREYVLQLATLWAKALGKPAPEFHSGGDIVWGGFEWDFGEWVYQIRADLKKAWIAARSENGYRSVIPDDAIKVMGVGLLANAVLENVQELDLAKALIDRGVSLGEVSSDGYYPFASACRWIDPKTAKHWLGRGARVGQRGAWGTPLHEAVLNERYGLPLMKLLLAHGASARALDYTGDTPLHKAMFGKPYKSMVDELLKAGADINARNREGRTPLFALVQSEAPDPALVEHMIRSGSNVDVRDHDGKRVEDVCGHEEIKAILNHRK